jgi:protein-S-isoprenylcysteine O-methyltransferase Ste14
MYFPTHPPVALITAILISWFFSTTAPHTFLVPTYLRPGVLLFWALAFILLFSAFNELNKKKTTIIPTGTPTALVTNGPYRLTRNPIYLGYLLIAFGVAWYFGSLTGFIGPLYFFWIVDGAVIPIEEKKLREAIGYPYTEYLLNTKRWL